jgi:LPXTG-motif cell wall-anchored protein
MKSQSLIPSGKAVAMLCGVVMVAGIVATPGRADEWDKRTILTVRNEPIQIRDTVLQPGQYVLRLTDSDSQRHVVQIFNRDQTRIINTVLAIPAQRLQPTGHTQFTFWETPPGMAKAMRTWYYPGDSFGQQFPYPKHLTQIAMAIAPAEPETQPAPQVEAQTESNSNTQAEATATQSESSETAQQQPAPAAEQPVETAQNTTPAASDTTATQQSNQLPKTSSPYPLAGLAGIVMLGLFGLLRLKRTA